MTYDEIRTRIHEMDVLAEIKASAIALIKLLEREGRSVPHAGRPRLGKAGKPLPSLHSDLFAPVPEPTIKTGVLTMSMAVPNLMGK